MLEICGCIAEIMNLRNLERVLAREEEVKKRAVVHKAVYTGPQIRYLSRNGKIPYQLTMPLKMSDLLLVQSPSINPQFCLGPLDSLY